MFAKVCQALNLHCRHSPFPEEFGPIESVTGSICLDSWKLFPANDDVNGVNDAWDVAQQGQQDVEPERAAEADLQKHTHGWQKDCDDEANDIHG